MYLKSKVKNLPFSARIAATVFASEIDTKRDHDKEDGETKVETKVENENHCHSIIGHSSS